MFLKQKPVSRLALVPLCLALLLFQSSALLGQSNSSDSQSSSGFGPIDPASPEGGMTPDQVIAKMSAQESQSKQALAKYTWTQDIIQQTLDGKKVTGEYHVVYNVTFDSQGHRTERVVFAPMDTLKDIIMTQNDVDELEHKEAFPLTEEAITNYDFSYVGRQKVDEVDTYVFDVKPKVLDRKHLRFQGRIWIDQQGFQTVISSGKFEPEDTRPGHEDLAPPATTYREQIDGKYWFPVYTHGEGVLHFHASKNSMSEDVHLRQIIKYTDYKQFGSSVRILGPDELKQQSK
jgi:hypothetical protein